jgi:hypothetical protein
MTPDPSSPDESALRALFDETSEEAAGPLLTRMAARAVDIPERAQRRPGWIPRWAWAPGIAGAVVALGVLSAAFVPTYMADREPTKALSKVVLAPLVKPPVAEASAATATATASAEPHSDDALLDIPRDSSPDDSLIAGLGADWDPNSPGGTEDSLDPLFGPASDADLDAWLYATEKIIREGS